jgi:acyl-CoA thioesterase-1
MKATTILFVILMIALFPLTAEAQLVACIGDSITAGAGISNVQTNGYPAQLQRFLRGYYGGWQVQNFGVGGTTMLRQGDSPYIRQGAYTAAQTYNPDIVVIMLGTNDSKPQNWQYKDSFIDDYCAMIDVFQGLPSRPRVWICKPVPAFQENFGIRPAVIRDEIVPMIDEIARRKNVPVIDLYTALLGYGSLFPDGIHPNAEGAGVIARTVASFLMGARAMPDFYPDGIMNLVDFAALAQQWLAHEPAFDIAPPPNGDGIVSHAELAVLSRYWLSSPWLVAHWPLDETAGTVAVDTLGHFEGTVHGAAYWRPGEGRIGGALKLDGVDDYVSVGNVINPADGPFTVVAWIKGDRPGRVIVSQTDYTGVDQIWLGTDAATGGLMTTVNDNGRFLRTLTGSTTVTDNAWHRVGLTWDGSFRRLYVDGQETAVDTQKLGTLKSATAGFYFGVRSNLDHATSWSGLIDDIRFYNRAVRP